MANLPVDFVEKVQNPPSVSGGYPYRISASDLMQNFHAAALEVDKTQHESGLRLEERTGSLGNGYVGRIVALAGTLASTGGTGGNLNLEIVPLSYDGAGAVYSLGAPSTFLYFRAGLFVGIVDPEDSPEGLITQQITWLQSGA